MGKMTKAMKRMNKKMNVTTISKIVQEFEMENEKAEVTQELMDDAIGDAFGNEEDEEEEDAIVAQVLDEIGVSLTGDIASAPTAPVRSDPVETAKEHAPQAVAADAEDSAVNDLEARLNNLRRGN